MFSKVQIQFEFEFKLKLNLNKKRKRKRKERAKPHCAGLDRMAHLFLSSPLSPARKAIGSEATWARPKLRWRKTKKEKGSATAGAQAHDLPLSALGLHYCAIVASLLQIEAQPS